MSTEACNLALKNTISEIRNVCPDISNILVFRENGEVLAEDENTTEVAMKSAQENFHALAEKASAVGGIESVTFRGAESKVNLIQFNDLYITTVSSNGADDKTISNLTRVMIPTTLKIFQDIYPQIRNRPQGFSVKSEQQTQVPEPVVPEVQASEYKVENLTVLGGFMIDPDTAYIDSALVVQWAEIYGDVPIKRITLQNPSTGRTTQCKYQPLKGEKYENKGIVKISDKIQTAINVQKGHKVLIRPILETEEDAEEDANEKTAKPKKPVEKPKFSNEPVQKPKIDVFKGFEEYTGRVPVIQVMVENLGGFGGLLPIKDSQLEGKGVTQIPEKLQQTLQTKKGALVLIKPVVDSLEE
jgi:hypothetical protein